MFVGPDELARLRASDPGVLVLEVRADSGPEAHVPGAVAVDFAELGNPDLPATEGRHPLPDPAALQAAARRWGVSEGSTVVVYDARASLAAARAWWVLRWAGSDRVAILDGGLRAWTESGQPVGDLAGDVVPGDVVVRPGGLPEIDADRAAALAEQGLLVDAREAGPYSEGHIPAARNAPSVAALGADNRLLPGAELHRHFGLADDGDPAPAFTCGSGVAAAFAVAVAAHLGVETSLHVGSFSAWSADPSRTVETGADTSGRAAATTSIP